jgi:hypothetical protein
VEDPDDDDSCGTRWFSSLAETAIAVLAGCIIGLLVTVIVMEVLLK